MGRWGRITNSADVSPSAAPRHGCLDGLQQWWQRSTEDKDPRLKDGAWRLAAETISQQSRTQVSALLEGGDAFEASCGSDERSPVAICEKVLAEYLGFKYCIGVNSYGSALFLTLKAAGVGRGTKVLGCALTFVEAPSAVHQTGAEYVIVDGTRDMIIDLRDLAWKADKTGAQFLLLSHMCGHTADLNEVTRICSDRGIVIIEDCANSTGVWWDGRHAGHHGIACVVSASGRCESVLDAGEGGFVATDDLRIAVGVSTMAGSYDASFKKRFAAPESSLFEAVEQGRFPVYGLTMSMITGVILQPQIVSLESRVLEANRKHKNVCARFMSKTSADVGNISSPYALQVLPQVRSSCSSFQFLINLGPKASACLLATAQGRGVPLQCLASPGDQRNFTHWAFLDNHQYEHTPECPNMRGLLRQTYVVALPPRLSDKDCARVGDVLVRAVREALKIAAGEPLPQLVELNDNRRAYAAESRPFRPPSVPGSIEGSRRSNGSSGMLPEGRAVYPVRDQLTGPVLALSAAPKGPGSVSSSHQSSASGQPRVTQAHVLNGNSTWRPEGSSADLGYNQFQNQGPTLNCQASPARAPIAPLVNAHSPGVLALRLAGDMQGANSIDANLDSSLRSSCLSASHRITPVRGTGLSAIPSRENTNPFDLTTQPANTPSNPFGAYHIRPVGLQMQPPSQLTSRNASSAGGGSQAADGLHKSPSYQQELITRDDAAGIMARSRAPIHVVS